MSADSAWLAQRRKERIAARRRAFKQRLSAEDLASDEEDISAEQTPSEYYTAPGLLEAMPIPEDRPANFEAAPSPDTILESPTSMEDENTEATEAAEEEVNIIDVAIAEPMPPQPEPPSAAEVATAINMTPLGSGGCVAHTLYRLGIFASVEDATTRLNYEIAPVLARKLLAFDYSSDGGFLDTDEVARRSVGIRDNCWGVEVMASALGKAGYNVLEIDLETVDLGALLRGAGRFLVDGVLNLEYTAADGVTVITNDPMDDTLPSPAEAPERWRHSVAVIDGTIFEQMDRELSVECLWLCEACEVTTKGAPSARPDVQRGYLRQIDRVFEVTVAGSTGSAR